MYAKPAHLGSIHSEGMSEGWGGVLPMAKLKNLAKGDKPVAEIAFRNVVI